MSRGDNPPLAAVFSRPQVDTKLAEIRAYIDHQRGNDPEDIASLKVLQEIFRTLFYIQTYPFGSRQVRGMTSNYRQRRVADSYLIYYYTNNEGSKVYLIELRHTSQRPLKPSTLRKYKGEIREGPSS